MNNPALSKVYATPAKTAMTNEDIFRIQQTLRNGYCQHPRRVNICAECLSELEKLLPAPTKPVTP